MSDTFAGRLGDVVTNPGRLMDNVGARPAWWQPGLLIFLVMTAFTWMVLPISAPEQVEMMRRFMYEQCSPLISFPMPSSEIGCAMVRVEIPVKIN